MDLMDMVDGSNVDSVSEVSPVTDFRILKVLLPDGRIEDWNVSITWRTPPEMTIKGSLGEWHFAERDLYEGLKALRRQVESLGGAVLCQGSRPNVWPSGMTRSMCAGGKAYVIEPGKTPSDLVSIFDPADRSEIGTVAEQEAEYKQWRAAREMTNSMVRKKVDWFNFGVYFVGGSLFGAMIGIGACVRQGISFRESPALICIGFVSLWFGLAAGFWKGIRRS